MSNRAPATDDQQATSAAPTDGRRARRERGRLAVSDAMVDLVFEGHVPPTAEQVAVKAGVSVASLFRYFETLDDLRHHTVARYFERYDHLFEIPAIGEGPLAVRIERFASARVELHETTAPMCRLTRTRAEPDFARATIDRVRATTADQIRHHFCQELEPLSPAKRDDVVSIINTLTSFESWDHLHQSSDRSRTQIVRAWTTALAAILPTLNGKKPHVGQ